MITKLLAVLATTAALGFTTMGSASAHGHDCDPDRNGHHECPMPPVPPVPAPCVKHLIIGTLDTDHLFGTSGCDLILGRGSHDVLVGKAGDDRLRGGRGNDTLRGGLGRDVMNGGPGRDTCIGTSDDIFRSCEITIVV